MPETHHPPGYKSRSLHVALLFTGLLGRIHPLVLTPIWAALAVAAAWPWASAGLAWAAAALSPALTAADGISLALLPRLGRSFGSVTPPLLARTEVDTELDAVLSGLGFADWRASRVALFTLLA